MARVGKMEGTSVSDILLDMGCTRTMIRKDLVPKECLLPGKAVTILCAHGDMALYPLARVRIEVEGVGMEADAAVSESLPVAALLGTDAPQLGRLLHANPMVMHTEGMDHAIVTTCAQSQRETEEREQQWLHQQDSGVEPHLPDIGGHKGQSPTDVDVGDGGPEMMGCGGECVGGKEGEVDGGSMDDGAEEGEGNGWDKGVVGGDFADDLFSTPVERENKTRKQKRESRRAYGLVRAKDGPGRGHGRVELDLSLEQLRQLQGSDNTLVGIIEGDRFFRKNGVLYRRWVERGQPEEAAIEQIVLPKLCRKAVLQLAHSIPLGGHLGKKKTTDRILKRFYWPSLHRDV